MPTTRDKIWAAVLSEIQVKRSFTAADIGESIATDPTPSRRTIRNALNSMVELGLLESEGGSGSAPREYVPIKPDDPLEPAGYEPRASNSSTVFPFPGSKSLIADWIVGNMPAHDTYVEVFGGSASVLFSKPKSKYEILNDISRDIVQFFEVLRDHGDELAEWLISVPFSRELYETWASEFYSHYRPSDDIERAGRFFAIRYMQYAGVSDSKNGFKVRARRSPARTFSNANRRINSLAVRLSDVTIEQQHYVSLIEGYDDASVDVLFYLDPPYAETSNQYGVDVAYDRLVEVLHSIDNDWMLSCAEVPDGLNDFTVLSRSSRHKIRQSDGEVTEFLVCNFDPEERTAFDRAVEG